MKFNRRSLLLGTTALTCAALAGAVVLMPAPALAACQTVNGADATITGSISCITWDSNSITVTGNGIVTGANTVVTNSSHTVGSLTNSGSIVGNYYGIDNNHGTIGSIINDAGGSISGVGFVGIVNNGSSSSIGAITNNGNISGGSSGGIYNGGHIGIITNSGVITTAVKFGITNIGSIGTIINTSVLSAASGGIGSYYGSIGTITNSGTIVSTQSCGSCAAIISRSDTIGTLTNSGLIGGPVAIFSDNTSTILGAISNTGTIAGNINVGQDLTFTGGNASTIGTLTGYSGSIGTITATNLTFDSAAYQLLDDNVNVNSGAGTVTNSGTLMIKATHTITGNYVQDSGALLTVGVIDPTHYGDLVIMGNATMTDDHVSITPASGTLTSGESFTIVQDTITGTAAYSGIMATATGFTASVSSITSGGFDDLIVSLSGGGGTYGAIGAAAGGGVAPAVGAALDEIHAGGNASFNSIFTALNNLGSISEASEQAGIKQLAPNQVMPQIAASGLLADQTVQVIGQHEEGLLAQNGDGPVGKAAGSEYESGIFWAQASGGVATQDSASDSGGYQQSFYGLTFGADDHIGKNTVLGLALGWMHSDAGGDGDLAGDTVSLDSIQFTGYGTRRFGPAFVDGMLGIGVNLYNQKRDVGFLDEQASAGYTGTQYMGRIEGGWDFAKNIGLPILAKPAEKGSDGGNFSQTVTLTPLAGFQAVRTDINAYSESGAGAADNAVGGQGVNSFATTLGGRVATVLPTAWGDFVPEIKAVWVHDLTGGAITTPASLGGVSFTTATPRVAQDGAQVTLAATLRQGGNVALRVEYDGDLRPGYISNSGLVKVEWGF